MKKMENGKLIAENLTDATQLGAIEVSNLIRNKVSILKLKIDYIAETLEAGMHHRSEAQVLRDVVNDFVNSIGLLETSPKVKSND